MEFFFADPNLRAMLSKTMWHPTKPKMCAKGEWGGGARAYSNGTSNQGRSFAWVVVIVTCKE
jgi:hypothetical protein